MLHIHHSKLAAPELHIVSLQRDIQTHEGNYSAS